MAAYYWWGRANKGKVDHLWVNDETLCALKTKTRHPWLHGSRRCSKCLESFHASTRMQAEYTMQISVIPVDRNEAHPQLREG